MTTTHFDRALARTPDFSSEGVGDWLKFGFRALIPLILYTTVLLLIVRLLATLWHFVQRLSPPVRRLSTQARTSISGTFGRIAGSDGASSNEHISWAK